MLIQHHTIHFVMVNMPTRSADLCDLVTFSLNNRKRLEVPTNDKRHPMANDKSACCFEFQSPFVVTFGELSFDYSGMADIFGE